MIIVVRKDAWAHVWTVARRLFLVFNIDLSVIAWVSAAAAFLNFNLISLFFFSKIAQLNFLYPKMPYSPEISIVELQSQVVNYNLKSMW